MYMFLYLVKNHNKLIENTIVLSLHTDVILALKYVYNITVQHGTAQLSLSQFLFSPGGPPGSVVMSYNRLDTMLFTACGRKRQSTDRRPLNRRG